MYQHRNLDTLPIYGHECHGMHVYRFQSDCPNTTDVAVANDLIQFSKLNKEQRKLETNLKQYSGHVAALVVDPCRGLNPFSKFPSLTVRGCEQVCITAVICCGFSLFSLCKRVPTHILCVVSWHKQEPAFLAHDNFLSLIPLSLVTSWCPFPHPLSVVIMYGHWWR